MERKCLECGGRLYGRTDKKFCTDACRNAYNNRLKSTAGNRLVRRINQKLMKNRNILVSMNPEGQTSVHKNRLLKSGFDFGFYTSQYKTGKGSVCYFCYDQGYQPMDDDFIMLVNRKQEAEAVY